MGQHEDDLTTAFEERMLKIEEKLRHTHDSLISERPRPYMAYAVAPFVYTPIWLALPPPPPPPQGERNLDLKEVLGGLIGDRIPKSGGFGMQCKWFTLLLNWTERPITKEVTIAHSGSIKVQNPGTLGSGDLVTSEGPGSVTIPVTLQPGMALKIHIEQDGSSFAAWW